MIFAYVKQGDKVISNAFGSGVVKRIYDHSADLPHDMFSVVFSCGDYVRVMRYSYNGHLAHHNGSRDLWYDDNGERSDVKPHVWRDSDIGAKALCRCNHNMNGLDYIWDSGWYYQGLYRGLHWFSTVKENFTRLYTFPQSKKDI